MYQPPLVRPVYQPPVLISVDLPFASFHSTTMINGEFIRFTTDLRLANYVNIIN